MTTPKLIRGRLYLVNGQPMKYWGINWEYDCHEFLDLTSLTRFYWDSDDDESAPPDINEIPNGFNFIKKYIQIPEVTL